MSYRVNEFRLALPDAAVQDSSINILRFEALATSLIISRSLLAEGETLQSNFDGQLQRLQQQVKDLRMQPAQAVQVGADQAIAAIELSSQFSKGQEKVYQYQLALVLPGTRRMFALSYVKASPLGAAEAAHWAAIKQSLDFDNLG
ncbi:DcrB-related protein [Pseudomonas sp. BCRC 81390]|uniref:DcrB-related protein n=1 Tax=Pseudomonas sp. BCRC 81390 TaxID=3054778 RepID=UPI002599E7E7|nr:DcrB-related protein [Pseudomonas sp. BCRC 81390]MDM3885622.1 DcrB-related protein [Pseudomonas sp. BCRC 81390]